MYSPEEIVKRARSRLGWEWDLNEDDRDFIERLMGWSVSLGFIKAPLDIETLLDLGPLRLVRRETSLTARSSMPRQALPHQSRGFGAAELPETPPEERFHG